MLRFPGQRGWAAARDVGLELRSGTLQRLPFGEEQGLRGCLVSDAGNARILSPLLSRDALK